MTYLLWALPLIAAGIGLWLGWRDDQNGGPR